MNFAKKLASVVVLSFLISGCQRTLVNETNYLLVSSYGPNQCYTRFVDGLPLDQICQKRGIYKYTDQPKLTKAALEVPSVVWAIFTLNTPNFSEILFGKKLEEQDGV